MSPFTSPIALAVVPTPACTGNVGYLEMLGDSKKAESNPEKSVLQQMKMKAGENVN